MAQPPRRGASIWCSSSTGSYSRHDGLKSEFKQAVELAMKQYRKTRLPKDSAANKPEPLLTFKRGALVHFAVSQYEAWMTTRLDGEKTRFLPFNKGTRDGAAGNDTPEDQDRYATDYLWNEVLAPENLLNIIGRFVHLEIKEVEDWKGLKSKKEALIFPRYHQWDLVRSLLNATRMEGPGHKYLAQHSAGSGKSNSIAWTAHQLSSLYDDNGKKVFRSVIVVTDRTVLDSQLQDANLPSSSTRKASSGKSTETKGREVSRRNSPTP